MVGFSPERARVGEELRITGTGWEPGKATIYLITDEQRSHLDNAIRSGALFPLEKVDVPDSGSFDITIALPEHVRSENGSSEMSVAPGFYAIGVGISGYFRSHGSLEVIE
jgi:hypothetical protein